MDSIGHSQNYLFLSLFITASRASTFILFYFLRIASTFISLCNSIRYTIVFFFLMVNSIKFFVFGDE